MKRGIAGLLAVTLVLSLGIVAGLHAQATKDAKTKLDRVEGTVVTVTKDKSEIVVRYSTKLQWTVVYGADTKFTYRNAASTIDEVKANRRVICLGKFNTEKTILTAERIDIRTGK